MVYYKEKILAINQKARIWHSVLFSQVFFPWQFLLGVFVEFWFPKQVGLIYTQIYSAGQQLEIFFWPLATGLSITFAGPVRTMHMEV